MLTYFIKKMCYALLTLWGVVSVVFFLFTILPGDPARMMLDQNESAEQLLAIKKKYGFDQPISKQYILYLNDLSPISFHSTQAEDYSFRHANKYNGLVLLTMGQTEVMLKVPYLRESFQKNGKTVSSILAETLPNTVLLATVAIGIALFIGVFLGVISALYVNTWLDRFISVVSTFGMSIPSFFSAILFAWIFGYLLHTYTQLPMTGSLYEVDDYGDGRYLALKNIILPAIVLGIRPLSVVIQLMRNSLLDVLSLDYIRTAKAKGMSMTQVIYKHALKNALNPVVTALSGWFASMLAGAVFVEYIFGWNGLGKEIVEALNTLDLPIIMGAVLTIATAFVILTILVDLIYAYLDPRIKLNE
ncbi:ABC transporter permease [Myroides sp. 1354]|uniref:ABC transporter permease n=1 Tax=unclassified Myroides TaxID=2642485 RepID=UPI002578268A|nr:MULTISPECIES: ABC transporter permease [unclassified Myroides]MDM1045306.1 ABC transporter permease [Myroides sp. R163-1]MDM1056188.1 ABC transporter permease [Myroides sp. 1354]MDM1069317.1 ABC transporter permease [Myroides sp. 1372]